MTPVPTESLLPTDDHFKTTSPSEPEYGGFWVRLGALLLDAIIASPFTLLMVWFATRNRPLYFASYVAYYVYVLWSMILLVRWRGGSPGKLLWGLQVVRTDLKPVGWREAWFREAVTLGTNLLQSAAYVLAVAGLSEQDYLGLSGHERYKKINELGGIPMLIATWVGYAWMGSEVLILLTNRRRRALHDFIAGTVVVRVGKERGCGLGLIVAMGFALILFLLLKMNRH